MPEKRKRTTIDYSSLDLDDEELREQLQVSEEIWETLSEAQKILILAKTGIKALKGNLKQSIDDNKG